MGRKGRGGGGRPRPVKGFRPGQEPPHLKKQRAKARLGSDASWLQKQTVEAIVGRSPREVETMVRNWSVGLLVVAIALAVLGVFLYRWSLVAGLVAHAVTLLPLFLAYRLRKQGPGLVEMAETLR